MSGRAYTLLELLIALAIVIGLAGLAAPIGLSRLARARFEDAGYELEATLTLARADAMRKQVPLRVVALQAADGTTRLRTLPDADPSSSDDKNTPRAEQQPAATSEYEQWVELPAGVRLVFDDPSAEPAREHGTAPAPSRAADVEPSEPTADRVVVIFFPDGQASRPTPCWMVGGDGQAAAVTINTWTGAVSVSRVSIWSADQPPPSPSVRAASPTAEPEP